MNPIVIKYCSYTYPDGTCAINTISLTIQHNEKVAIIGNNGSGKSTLLLMLSGLLLPTDGTIEILNMPLNAKNKIAIRKNIGILFSQVEYQFIMPDVLNDVMLSIKDMPIEKKKATAIKWLHCVQLDDIMYHSPLSLSSGQMKRAALAAQLAKNPQLLLLDEPLANLDKPSSDAVIHLLQDLQLTLVFATHSFYLVEQLADRIIVLEKGKVVCDSKYHKSEIKQYTQRILL